MCLITALQIRLSVDQGCKSGFKKPWFLGLKKNYVNLKSPNFRFFGYCVTNLIKKKKNIFKYELRFVAITWPNLCSLDLDVFSVLVGRNFETGIFKSKPKNYKNLKPIFCNKK